MTTELTHAQKEAKRANWRRWYRENKAYYNAQPYRKGMNKTYRRKLGERARRNRDWIWAYKETHPCKCGYAHPAALQFHHRDPSTKRFALSEAVWKTKSIENLQQEIDKCDILCANCHAVLHYEERVGLEPGQSGSTTPNP